MIIKVLALVTLILGVITSGCGLAIHFKWVGEMEPTPHIVLTGILLISLIAELVLVMVLV